MEHLSVRLTSLSSSATLAMSQKSNELKAQGVDVINLSVGEPDFFTPDPIKAAAKKAIVAKLKRENGLDYTVDQIIVSNGAKQSICNTLLCLVDPGDEVIVPAPYWVSYVEMVKLAEGTNVILPASIDQNFKITPEQLEAAITPKTKALILCTPSNPTGSVYSHDELEALADVLARHPQVVVISDEIYEHINYVGRHASIASFPVLRDRVAVINGVSKAYAMTGWRIGFLAAPLWLARAASKLQGQYTSGPSSIAQKAACEAFSGDQTCVEEMRVAFKRRRDLICRLCREIPDVRLAVPDGAFYIFPDVSRYFGRSAGDRKVYDSADLAMYLLETAHVATVGGHAFGAPDCIRLSYAASDEAITEAMRRITKALSELK